MVVRPQRRRVLPDDAVPRADVLLPAQGRRTARSSRTGSRSSTSGRWSSSTSGPARTTCTTPRCRSGPPRSGMLFSRDALDAVLGRHDQRPADAARRLAQGRRRPGPQVLRRRHHLLRHGDVRRPAALDQERQRALALHRLDDRPRARGRARLERLHDLRHDVLARCRASSRRSSSRKKLAELHFWLGTIGILLYIVAIYARGRDAGPDVAGLRRAPGASRIPTSSRPSCG